MAVRPPWACHPTAPAPLTVNGLVSVVMTGATWLCRRIGQFRSTRPDHRRREPGHAPTWSHGPTTGDLAGLSAGSYDVDVLDANGCSATASFSLTARMSLRSEEERSWFPGDGARHGCTRSIGREHRPDRVRGGTAP